MKSKIQKMMAKLGKVMCATAVSVASVASLCCRAQWYQPEEPEGLQEFIQAKKKL